ncbi:MAG: DUF2723 domain-containing protein [Candidatus Firestonebacteria bacterium]
MTKQSDFCIATKEIASLPLVIRNDKNVKMFPALSVFLISFAVYLHTICPSIYVGDSGELITASYNLGISHPPGYPIWCVLSKIWTIIIPYGDIAFRVNISSAFFAALSVLFLYLIIIKLFIKGYTALLAGGTGAMLFAFSRTFWSQSVVAEVYTLNILFFAIVLYLIILWSQEIFLKRKNLLFYLFCLFYGLGLAHHHTMLLFLPAFFAYILTNEMGIYTVKNMPLQTYICGIGFFLIGLLFFLYIPIRGFANPVLDWGNPTSFMDFIDHILRKRYGILMKHSKSFTLLLNQIIAYSRCLADEFAPHIIALVSLGLIQIKRFNSKFLSFTILLLILSSLSFMFLISYEIKTIELEQIGVFFIPSYFIFSILFGSGAYYLLEKFKGVFRYGIAILLLIIPFVPFAYNYYYNNKASYTIAYNYGINILKTLEENACFLGTGDNQIFTLAYFKMVEGIRRDVTVYDDFGLVFANIYGKNFLKMPGDVALTRRRRVHESILHSKRPVYFSIISEANKIEGVNSETLGILYKVKRKSYAKKMNDDLWNTYRLNGVHDDEIYKDFMTRFVIVQYHYFLAERYFASNDIGSATKEALIAEDIGYDIDWVQNSLSATYIEAAKINDAMRTALKAVKINPDYAEAHSNLGIALYYRGFIDNAIYEYKRAITLNPVFAIAYNNLGCAYAAKGDIKAANISWKNALKIAPDYKDPIKNMKVSQRF